MIAYGWADKWIEIDVDDIRWNLEQVRSCLQEGVRLIAVVKANAYGHGAQEVARILYQQGVDFFAVSYLKEALDLRRSGLRGSILLLTPLINEDQVLEAVENHLTLTITSLPEAEIVDKVTRLTRRMAAVHLKVDTGLGRFGMNLEQTLQCCELLKQNSHIYIEGIYTHMAEGAARSTRYTQNQFNQFMKVVNGLMERGYIFPIRHCANSAVLLNYPHMQLDAVRVGTLISGQHPAGKIRHRLELRDPYHFKCRIISVRHLPKGSYLGYNRTYRLKNPAQVAVLPVGYHDGLALAVDNPPSGLIDLLKILAKTVLRYFHFPRLQMKVAYKGHLYPVRGKVFMQMCLVEMPADLEVQVGDEVEVPIRKTLALGSVMRLYVREGKAGKMDNDEYVSYVIEEDFHE
ncbi:MAG: alanine racemase [Syntrophomonadaceae bacterium]|nr:alanine racemase [Syntrophomonadaceae bacterium]